ncbi:MAG: glycine oxidase ThiO [Candidatus Omnitrophica bacterium]|nr:glycine oxidase ThiO [Candidatus Omnitrophota bacterium]
MEDRAEVLIAGGGVIGLAIACELRKQGLDVLLVEKGSPGKEASLAAVGVLAPHAGPGGRTPFLELLRRSLSIFPQFVQELEREASADVDFRRGGLYYLALDEKEDAELSARREWQLSAGIEAEPVSAAEIIEDEPWVGENVLKGIRFPDDCQVDNQKLVAALLDRAGQLGVRFRLGEEVLSVLANNGRAAGIRTQRGSYEGRCVVLASGAWSGSIAGLAFKIPVRPSRGQILEFQADRPLFRRVIHTPGIYLVSRADGRIFVGTTVESAGFERLPTAKGMHKLVSGLLRINPRLENLKFNRAWTGFRPRSKDSQPVLGRTPVEGLFLATGHFRNGILLAPLTARLIRDLILERAPEVDLTPFEIGRFT